MKAARILVALIGLAAIVPLSVDEAFARGRSRVSVGIGVGIWDPWWGPWGPWGPRSHWGGYWGPSPWYFPPPPPVMVVRPPEPPPVFIERSPPPSSGFWYYCRNPAGYYPYVNICRDGWLKVRPLQEE